MRRLAKFAPVLVSIAALAWTAAAHSQAADRPDPIETLERRVLELESEEGPNSAELIDPLLGLSTLYEEAGESILAVVAVQRALALVRMNYGLYTLEQAALLRRLIARAESIGDRRAAWDLEQSLLRLAERNPEDVRTARILRDTADRRMDVLERYIEGELPEEVILGCYYVELVPVQRRDADGPVNARGTTENSCTSGSRRRVIQRLSSEAQAYYSQAINILLANEEYSSPELPALLIDLVDSSYRYGNPALGERSLRFLLAYQTTNAAPLLDRVATLVHIADWSLLYADGTNGYEAALVQYAEALQLAESAPAGREWIARNFAPEIPICLPAFIANPLVTSGDGSIGYLDVSFVVDRYGRSRDVEILDSTQNVTRAEERRVRQLIEQSHYRPQLVSGRFAETEPFVMRYFLHE